MYRNLLVELTKEKISKQDLANILNVSVKTLMQKLSGQNSFDMNECFKIKSVIAENRLGLAYLFEDDKDLEWQRLKH